MIIVFISTFDWDFEFSKTNPKGKNNYKIPCARCLRAVGKC